MIHDYTEQEIREAYRVLFDSPMGQVVLADLSEKFGRANKSQVIERHASLAYLCGQEDVLNHIEAARQPMREGMTPLDDLIPAEIGDPYG